MFLSINIVRAIVEELMRQGHPLERICQRTGVAAADLADATRRLPFDRSTRVVAAALELSATPAIGLHVGETAPLKALHVVGHLLASCSTMREAIALFLRYSALVFEGGVFRLVEEAEDARFVYEHPVPGSRLERFAAEVSLAVALRLGRLITGPDTRPTALHLRHDDPGYAAEYARLFSCPVAFGQPANQLVFDRALLDVAHLQRDDLLCGLLRERADRLLTHVSETERLAERIVEALKLQVELGDADPARIAEQLGMPLHSLQRHLSASSLSLSRLYDQARREIACTALRHRDTPIKEIAHRLGFSEPSAFHRAFKRWTGMTPTQYRQRGA